MNYWERRRVMESYWRDEDTERRWMFAYWATVIVGGLVMFISATGGL